MWQSIGLALILLFGLNVGISQGPSIAGQGAPIRVARREAHSGLPGRGDRSVVRAAERRAPAGVVRRHAGGGQPAVAIAEFLPSARAASATIASGLEARPRNAIWESAYAPRAPPGTDRASLHAG